jgi:hypothetical protein
MSKDMVAIDLRFIDRLKHSPIKNYAIPGLTSWMIGEVNGLDGCVRLFECSRTHVEQIIPHSHRFDFKCQVLEGEVINRYWINKNKSVNELRADRYDPYQASELIYSGNPGEYTKSVSESGEWRFYEKRYTPGQVYSMTADEVHSIIFSKGAKVLFEEGPTVSDRSIVLEPIVDGEVIPTFKVESWMFKKNI